MPLNSRFSSSVRRLAFGSTNGVFLENMFDGGLRCTTYTSSVLCILKCCIKLTMTRLPRSTSSIIGFSLHEKVVVRGIDWSRLML